MDASDAQLPGDAPQLSALALRTRAILPLEELRLALPTASGAGSGEPTVPPEPSWTR